MKLYTEQEVSRLVREAVVIARKHGYAEGYQAAEAMALAASIAACEREYTDLFYGMPELDQTN